MTKDDILQALRLTAMGRCGHPLQEELADKLAKVLARDWLERQCDDLTCELGVMKVTALPDTPAAPKKPAKKAR